MGGGLMNLVAYGNQNIILNGNPSKTFFKFTYNKYTNFGLQKFRIDMQGQRTLNLNQESKFTFKILDANFINFPEQRIDLKRAFSFNSS